MFYKGVKSDFIKDFQELGFMLCLSKLTIQTTSNEFVIDHYDQNMFIYVKNVFWVKPKSIDFWKNRRTSRFMNSGRN